MHMDCRSCLADFVSIRRARAGCKLVEPPLTSWRLSIPKKDMFSISLNIWGSFDAGDGRAMSQTDNSAFPEPVLQRGGATSHLFQQTRARQRLEFSGFWLWDCRCEATTLGITSIVGAVVNDVIFACGEWKYHSITRRTSCPT